MSHIKEVIDECPAIEKKNDQEMKSVCEEPADFEPVEETEVLIIFNHGHPVS